MDNYDRDIWQQETNRRLDMLENKSGMSFLWLAIAIIGFVVAILITSCGVEHAGDYDFEAAGVDAGHRPVSYIVVQPSPSEAYRLFGPRLTLQRMECLELCTCLNPEGEVHCMCPCKGEY